MVLSDDDDTFKMLDDFQDIDYDMLLGGHAGGTGADDFFIEK